MGWAIWWPMQENSESKIGQQDRKDHVVQTPKKLLRERARLHVNMLGTVSHLFIRWSPNWSGTCALRGLVGVLLHYKLRARY
jgi:hypothetical protein